MRICKQNDSIVILRQVDNYFHKCSTAYQSWFRDTHKIFSTEEQVQRMEKFHKNNGACDYKILQHFQSWSVVPATS